MANRFQQMAQQRKWIYFLLIAGLFTASLLHRNLVIVKRAQDLQLLEKSRGEVELTSSAVRLTLTGSRGLAVTLLWSAAIKKQEQHDWNEVELLVSSITKLQPYFITPWVFQSWNLAFNVAVECDRPIDKYYYVSRGLELLAEGERRNQGREDSTTGETRFPGNPDMRHHMGMTYQLKMGTSDEKHTMRCLLDLSCIDPAKRDARLLANDKGEIKEDEFKNFCRNYPRLVRRLRDHLGYESEKQIVEFLVDSKDVPSRFEAPVEGQSETPTKGKAGQKHKYQFPSLPRAEADWPNPENYDLTSETINVYLMARTWLLYAQKPLPRPFRELRFIVYNPQENRVPKQMALILFRATPARAQAFIAETLQEDGWFDGDGWAVPGWFDRDSSTVSEPVVIGREPKYHSGPSWAKAHDMYRDYGSKNGMYLTDMELRDAEAKAAVFRKIHDLKPGTRLRDMRSEVLKDETSAETIGYHANELLLNSVFNRKLTNFDAHFYQSEAERTAEAVLARKIYYQAEKARRQSPEKALELYEEANPLWMDVLLAHPNFAQGASNQEDTYEVHLKYLRHKQRERPRQFQKVAMGMWQVLQSPYAPLAGALVVTKNADNKQILVQWPFLPWESLLSEGDKNKIMPIRNIRGPFDMTYYFEGTHAGQIKDAVLLWTQGASLGMPMIYPGQRNLMLTRAPLGGMDRFPVAIKLFNVKAPVEGTMVRDDADFFRIRDRNGQDVSLPRLQVESYATWRPLIGPENIMTVRDRLGLNK